MYWAFLYILLWILRMTSGARAFHAHMSSRKALKVSLLSSSLTWLVHECHLTIPQCRTWPGRDLEWHITKRHERTIVKSNVSRLSKVWSWTWRTPNVQVQVQIQADYRNISNKKKERIKNFTGAPADVLWWICDHGGSMLDDASWWMSQAIIIVLEYKY